MRSRSHRVTATLVLVLGACTATPERRSSDSSVPSTASPHAAGVPPKPIHLETGEGSTCALLDDGAVWCWGKLDIVVGGALHPPTRMTELPPVRALAVGLDACAISRDDQIICGWLGLGAYTVSGVENASEVAVSDEAERACAIAGDGAVSCWEPPRGDRRGQHRSVSATLVEGVAPAAGLVLGREIGCAWRRDDGKLQCWNASGPIAVDSQPVGAVAFAGAGGCGLVGNQVRCSATRGIDVATFGEISELGMSSNGVCGRSAQGRVFCATRDDRFGPKDDVVAGAHEIATSVDVPRSQQLTVSPTHACSLSVAGDIDCWGSDGAGQVSGRSARRLPPTELPLGNFSEIALGGYRTTCVLSNNVVACTDSEATCPTGTFQSVRAQSWHESRDEHWEHVHVLGSGHGVCVASRRQRAVWDRRGAADDRSGAKAPRKGAEPKRAERRVEDTEFLVCLAGDQREETAYRLPQGTLGRAAQLLLGDEFGCIRTTAGGVECFELGERHASTPRILADDMRADDGAAVELVRIAVPPATTLFDVQGYGHACALTVAGDVLCWQRLEPPQPSPAKSVKAVAGGRDRMCAIDADGHVGCNELDRPLERIEALERTRAIAVGSRHGCAIDDRGRVRCWEMHGHFSGQRPEDCKQRDASTPVELPGAATELFAGGGTTCARLESGRVFCWGDNSGGRLGVGISTCHADPVRVPLQR